MSLQPVSAILWKICQAADVRALLGRGGGHQVIPWDDNGLWKETLNVSVAPEDQGGTSIHIEAEPGAAPSFDLSAYYHQGRSEVRIKVPPILVAGSNVALRAQSSSAAIDPDGSLTDHYVVLLIKTLDGKVHLRSYLRSSLPEPVSGWLQPGSPSASGRRLGGLDDQAQQVWETLLRRHTVLLYGPPGTGKTRLMLQIRGAFEHGPAAIAFDPSDLANPLKPTRLSDSLPRNRKGLFTTFHQSLTYETFVVGLRPIVPSADADGSAAPLHFGPKDGIFLNLAAHSLKDESCSLLLIDELNRGNVADIFGELITLLESDKRLGKDGRPTPLTISVTLPLQPESPELKQSFQMPYHFYLLASMNSLDRSVAPLDSALRRRFRLVRLNQT
jgi:MoxR-like ATPase